MLACVIGLIDTRIVEVVFHQPIVVAHCCVLRLPLIEDSEASLVILPS
jgi:hypothetical protein